MRLVGLAIAGLVLAAGPASAQYMQRPPAPVGESSAIDAAEIVEAMGLTPVGPPARSGVFYVQRAVDDFGRLLNVTVDARRSQVVAVEAASAPRGAYAPYGGLYSGPYAARGPYERPYYSGYAALGPRGDYGLAPPGSIMAPGGVQPHGAPMPHAAVTPNVTRPRAATPPKAAARTATVAPVPRKRPAAAPQEAAGTVEPLPAPNAAPAPETAPALNATPPVTPLE